jgi:hypothetical protein
MSATALAAIPAFQVILFGEAFVSFGGDVKITLLKLHFFLKESHYTKIPISYLVFMFVFVNRHLIPKNFTGMSLWPFIILKYSGLKGDNVFLNHERIHLRQQIELLILPFYIWYGFEYLLRLLQFRNRKEAYRNISFEREAYKNEKDLDYLKKRSFWRFILYM